MSTIIGSTGDDTLTGTTSADTIEGLDGNDSLTGGLGNDSLAGGAGADAAMYGGVIAGYDVEYDAVTQYFIVTDTDTTDGNDGVDVLAGIDRLEFTDGAIDLTDLTLASDGTVVAPTPEATTWFLGGASNGDSGTTYKLAVGAGIDVWYSLASGARVKLLDAATGEFIYDPQSYSGDDSFDYVLRSGGVTSYATVSVTDGIVADGWEDADGAAWSGATDDASFSYNDLTLTGPNKAIMSDESFVGDFTVEFTVGGSAGTADTLSFGAFLVSDDNNFHSGQATGGVHWQMDKGWFVQNGGPSSTTHYVGSGSETTTTTTTSAISIGSVLQIVRAGDTFSYKVDGVTAYVWSDVTSDQEVRVFFATGGTGVYENIRFHQPVGGTSGNDAVVMDSSNNVYDGQGGADKLDGREGDDVLNGGSGDDLLVGGAGNDTLIGGVGFDKAQFSGDMHEFNFSFDSQTGLIRIQDNDTTNGDEGTDIISGIEHFIFDDDNVAIGDLSIAVDAEIDMAQGRNDGWFLTATGTNADEFFLIDGDGDEIAEGVWLDIDLGYSLRVKVVDKFTGAYEFDVGSFTGVANFDFGVKSNGALSQAKMSVNIRGSNDAIGSSIGSAVAINTTISGDQDDPSIATLSNGNLIVTWTSSNGEIMGQVVDADGVKVGSEWALSDTSDTHVSSDIAALAFGGFAVVWNPIGDADVVVYRVFDNSGTALGDSIDMQIAGVTTGQVSSPSIEATSDGGFFISVSAGTSNPSPGRIFKQEFDGNGAPVSDLYQVAKQTHSLDGYSDGHTTMAVLSDGSHVISWQQGGQTNLDIYFQLFDQYGDEVSDPVLVNAYTTDNQQHSLVRATENGGFVVAWQSDGNDGFDSGIYAQFFDGNGTAVGSNFRVNNRTTTSEQGVDMVTLGSGEIAFVFTSRVTETSSGDTAEVYARRFTTDGIAIDSEDQFIGYGPTSRFTDASLTPIGERDFAIVWHYEDGVNGDEIVMSRYSVGTGTFGNDLIVGGSAGDHLTSNEGNDKIDGEAGDDTLDGGEGNDLLIGGAGNDTLLGGNGGDSLTGSSGIDTLDGGVGFDYAYYSDQSASVTVDIGVGTGVGSGIDTDILINIEGAFGSSVDDTLTGSSDDNYLAGGNGNDSLYGGSGNDILVGGVGNDLLDGGAGSADVADFSDFTSTVIVDMETGTATGSESGTDTLLNIEIVRGSESDDMIDGDTANDTFIGGLGNDTLSGDDGDDMISDDDAWTEARGTITDWATAGITLSARDISQQPGDVTVVLTGGEYRVGVTGNVDISGWTGTEQQINTDGAGNSETLIAEFNSETPVYGAKIEYTNLFEAEEGGERAAWAAFNAVGQQVADGTFDPLIRTNEGRGSITITLETGFSRLEFTAVKTVSEQNGTNADPLDSSDFFILGITYTTSPVAGGDDVMDGGNGNDVIVGGFGDDTLLGGSGADSLNGEQGDDWLDGGSGDDSLFGDSGADYLIGGSGNDILDGGFSNDMLLGESGADTLSGMHGDDTLRGGSGNDTLDGGSGIDTLEGGGGDDWLLDAGTDADVFVFDFGSGDDTINGFDVGDDVFSLLNGLLIDSVSQTDVNGDQITDSVVTFDDGGTVTILGVSVTEPDLF